MLSRRFALLSFAALTFLAAASSRAAEPAAYSDAAFQAALATGEPVLIDIDASWCPTCAAQRPIIGKLLSERFKQIVEFRVDFDSQKDAVRKFGARSQSTLILFSKGKEAGRSVGDTNPASIEALLQKSS